MFRKTFLFPLVWTGMFLPGMFGRRCCRSCIRSVGCKYCQGYYMNCYWMTRSLICTCHVLLRMKARMMEYLKWNVAFWSYISLSEAAWRVPILACLQVRIKRRLSRTNTYSQNLQENIDGIKVPFGIFFWYSLAQGTRHVQWHMPQDKGSFIFYTFLHTDICMFGRMNTRHIPKKKND